MSKTLPREIRTYRKATYWMFAIMLSAFIVAVIVGSVFLFTRHDEFKLMYIYIVAMGSFAFIMGAISLLIFSGVLIKKHKRVVPKTFIGQFKLYMCRISERKSFWIRNIILFLIGNLAFATMFIYATNWALWIDVVVTIAAFFIWFPLLVFFIGTSTLVNGRFTFYRDSMPPAKVQLNMLVSGLFFAAPAIYATPLILLALKVI